MLIRQSAIQPLAMRTIRALAAAAIALAVLGGRDWSLEARQALFGQSQVQIYVPYSGASPIYLPPVLLVAHNAGNHEQTARQAIEHNAAGIEVDVRYVNGVLYATHSAPSGYMPLRAWQATRLRDAWHYLDGAKVLKLDLKSTNQAALESLVRFIQARPTEQQILLVSKNEAALEFLGEQLPQTVQILSLATGNDVDRLLEVDERLGNLDGVSVPVWALSPHRVEGLKTRGYLIDAWTVNDTDRLVELTTMGVDAITTDNLAFFGMTVGADASGSTSD